MLFRSHTKKGGTWETCSSKSIAIAPDITKPENFWPLVNEMRSEIPGRSVEFSENGLRVFDLINVKTIIKIKRANAGLAVAFAYLKIKESK